MYIMVFIVTELLLKMFSFLFPLGMQTHELTFKIASQKSQNSQLKNHFEGLLFNGIHFLLFWLYNPLTLAPATW